ncbi:nucleoside triphosphate pyrophosphohydrolase [Oscillatoria sp. FACHB-1407]|uniref:nucleoside triphosphate pyrophosphohydrolase n=1 Tax=Oscillatoria sp. FACHB-1407 TaxID=2692847 RepID=UPI001686392E|nr:nucleoside triphosphate pyrophosphohydrolase [Oscillatoria sp. FACHB-1407]MBD2465917.1 nucleoside triphosphate pyrophosphohydrolase [Oscillatoria sp. FACHB-1407]
MLQNLVFATLVRDRIPEIIRQSGRECGVETMDEEEFRQALRAKLVEEAQEAAAAIDADLVTELADLCEVMDALMVASGIDRETVLKEQKRRRLERGGFSRRIRLLWSGAD